MVEIRTLMLETWTDGGRLDASTIDAPTLVCQLDGFTILTTDPLSAYAARELLERCIGPGRLVTLMTRRIVAEVLGSFPPLHRLSPPSPIMTTVSDQCGLPTVLVRRQPWRAHPPRRPGLYLSQPRHRRAWPLAELLDPPATWRYQLRAFLHRCYLSVEPIMAECLFVWRYVWLWLNLTWRWIRYGSEPADPSQFD